WKVEMTNEKPWRIADLLADLTFVPLGNGMESYDKRRPDHETKRTILDHDAQRSAVERHWRERCQSRSGLFCSPKPKSCTKQSPAQEPVATGDGRAAGERAHLSRPWTQERSAVATKRMPL